VFLFMVSNSGTLLSAVQVVQFENGIDASEGRGFEKLSLLLWRWWSCFKLLLMALVSASWGLLDQHVS
jgi:hypothetical protein